jgi:hypothetical protein
MNFTTTFILIAIGCALPASLRAQWTLSRSVIAGGGGWNTTGAAFSLSGTVGQPDAGGPATGGGYSLAGGFWAGTTRIAPLGQPRLDAESVIADQVRLSWSVVATGYVLEQTAAFAASEAGISWSQVPPPYETNAARVTITLPLDSTERFYRLRKP